MKKIFSIFFILIVSVVLAQESSDSDTIWNQIESFYDQGIDYGRAGKLDSALHFTQASIELHEQSEVMDSILLANSYQSMGIIYRLLGKYDQAMDYYDQAELIYHHLDEKFLIAHLYHNKSIILKTEQNLDKAKDFLNQAILIYNQDSIQYKYQIANSLNSLGNIYYRENNIEKALRYYSKSLKLKKEKDFAYSTVGNMARCYNKLSEIKLADTYYNKAIEMGAKFYGDSNNVNLSVHYLNYASFLGEQNKSEKALRFFRKAININIANFGNKHPKLAISYNDLGTFYLNNNQPDSAIHYFQKSLIAISPKLNDMAWKSNPTIDSVMSKTHLLSALKDKAYAISLLADSTNQQKYYLVSLKTYDLAIETIEKIRSGYISEESKLLLAENEFETFSQALQVSYKLFELTKEDQYINKAFQYSEAGKSAILTEALKNTQALNIGGIPDSLLTSEKQLEKRIWDYEELIYEENKKKSPDQNKMSYWKRYLFELKEEYDKLIVYLEKNYPKYYELKYHRQNLSLDAVQQELSRKDAILEFFFTDQSIYAILIDQHQTDLIKIEIEKAFDQHLDHVLAALSNNNFSNHGFDEFKQFNESAYYIYSRVIKPVEEFIKNKNLTIIPDGKLAYLPFGALITKDITFDRINYKALPYFVYNQDVNYSYSASFLFEDKQYQKIAEKDLGAFAPTYKNLTSIPQEFANLRQEYREKLFPLKGIKTEVKQISSLLQGDQYLDQEANETRFKQVAHYYDILHLAMHTIMDDQNPMYSKMAFTQQTDSTDDGFLNTYELYNMKLNSRMAVLSSCNSGSGRLQRGEGVMSLARGFIYSGCPSIIMTLWSVEDKSGVKLMTSFYEQLLKGKSKSKAIQQSKIDFIEHADQLRSHPYFWSGYVAIGNNQPLFRNTMKQFLWISIIGLFLLTIIIYIIRKRKLTNRS